MINIIKRTPILILLLVLFFPSDLFGANFGVKPAYPREDNPRTESIFVQEINPGESAEDGVKIINSTNESKNLVLYARDSVRSSGGGFACTQISEKPEGVGSWIKFNIEEIDEELVENVKKGEVPESIEVTIPATTEIIIPFLISVPKGYSVGEHNGCVLIQEKKEKSGDEVGVSLSLRSGIRVAVNIPGDIVRELKFKDFKIEKKGKSIYLKPSVENTGNVSIDTNVQTEVRYFFGLLHEKFGGEFPVLRDEVYDFTFELKKPFWGGFYYVKNTFEYDGNEGASIGVTTDNKTTKIKSDSIWFFSSPTILGLISEISILLVLLFIFAMWRLKKKKEKWIKKWVPYTVKEDETLQKISQKTRVHWEIIVEVNKIKPPYTLEEGQEILIPPYKNKKSVDEKDFSNK